MNPAPQEIHRPVLTDVVLRMFAPLASKTVVDGTLGLGGHSEALLQEDRTVRVVGFDRDPEAIALARQRLSNYGDRFRAIQANTRDLNRHLDVLGEGPIDGLLLDLGVSSLQLDRPDRGFSFRHDGPLDMRMNPTEGPTASEWLNQADETEIRHCLATYGEERFAPRIARALVRERAVRPIRTTGQLPRSSARRYPFDTTTAASTPPPVPSRRFASRSTKSFRPWKRRWRRDFAAYASAAFLWRSASTLWRIGS
mgnify:CR=1 FL=1